MTSGEPWPTIAVMGAGAVGCYFGGMLARAGAPVTLIGRAPHVAAIASEGVLLDTLTFRERIQVAATTEAAAARAAALVLVCVKATDTDAAAAALAPHLEAGAVVVSLQNGVDNVERLRRAGLVAVPAAVYVAVAMAGPGHVRHTGRGDLVVGDGPRALLERVAEVFERAGVACRIAEDIDGELWTKVMVNCAFNAISALGRARYETMVHNAWTRSVMRAAVEETVAVARAAGVRLPDVDFVEATYRIADSMGSATSSTAHDIARGRRTEIDSLNGYIARRGAELGVPTPVNATLHALVKLLEAGASHPHPS